MSIDYITQVTAPICREFDVGRLELFGSIARGTSTESSDVDLLVTFREPENQPAKRFFGLLHQLEDSLKCEIDLLTPSGLRNPYLRKRIFEESTMIYEN